MVTEQTLPRAERQVLDASPDCGAYRWTGGANDMIVTTIVNDPNIVLYVRASIGGRVWTLALVDANGKVHALTERWG